MFKKNLSFLIFYFGITLVLIGALVTFLFGEEGFIEIKEKETVNGYWVEDDVYRNLSFSISLKDFSVELYPKKIKGMDFVKSYKAQVAINKGGNLLKDGIIEVNKPLRFKGFWFYQYGYDSAYPDQTLFQVVKDPGLPFVYGGYLILALGLLASFKRIWKI